MNEITELAKRVLELDKDATPGGWSHYLTGQWQYNILAPIGEIGSMREKSLQQEFSPANVDLVCEYRTAAPKLAQAVLELQDASARWEALSKLYLETALKVSEEFRAEIAALRPDAQAWREREARYQAEKQELEKRMGR